MTVPFEQLNSDSFFQQANLCAKRWLGQVKSFGRTPEIEFFGNRDWPVASAVAIAFLVLLVGPIALYQHYNTKQLES